jgi:hypothetical protein
MAAHLNVSQLLSRGATSLNAPLIDLGIYDINTGQWQWIAVISAPPNSGALRHA